MIFDYFNYKIPPPESVYDTVFDECMIYFLIESDQFIRYEELYYCKTHHAFFPQPHPYHNDWCCMPALVYANKKYDLSIKFPSNSHPSMIFQLYAFLNGKWQQYDNTKRFIL